MRFGVVTFPGSNCDYDMIHVLREVLHQDVEALWHKNEIPDYFTEDDYLILPGGFSYGDYLRSGAIARFSKIMESVISFAERGGKVIGICNGFQILCESGLLPGVLVRNQNQKFICKNIYIKQLENNSVLYNEELQNTALKIPIAHAEGRFYADNQTLNELKENNQIVYQYCDVNGDIIDSANLNGSVMNIAGISNKKGNIVGLMPHPERAAEKILGNEDGRLILETICKLAY